MKYSWDKRMKNGSNKNRKQSKQNNSNQLRGQRKLVKQRDHTSDYDKQNAVDCSDQMMKITIGLISQ